MNDIEDVAKDIVDAAIKSTRSLVRGFSNLLISSAMRTNFANVADKY